MVDYSKIFASSPINRQAALSTSKGFEYTPSKKVTALEWVGPPPIRPPRKSELCHPDFKDLKGIVVGRLTVLGILKDNPREKQTWVCRCACGTYVARTSRAIKNLANQDDRCEQCRHVQFLQRRDSAEQKAEMKAKGFL